MEIRKGKRSLQRVKQWFGESGSNFKFSHLLSMLAIPYLQKGQCQAQPWLSGASCLAATATSLLFKKEALDPHLTNAPGPAACQARCASSGCPPLAAESEPWQRRRPDSKAHSYNLFCPFPTSISLHSINLPPHMFSTSGSCRVFRNAEISGIFWGEGKRNTPQFIYIYIKTETDRVPRRWRTFPFQEACLPKAQHIRGVSPPEECCRWVPPCPWLEQERMRLAPQRAVRSSSLCCHVLLPRCFGREDLCGTALVSDRHSPEGNNIRSRL